MWSLMKSKQRLNPTLVPVLVPEPDEPVEHDHVGVDLPGEDEELVGERAAGPAPRAPARRRGCQLDNSCTSVILSPRVRRYI